MGTLQVRWYGRVTASHTGERSDIELIVRPVLWTEDRSSSAKSLWTGLLVLKGQHMQALAVSASADAVLSHMKSLGERLGIPVRIEDRELHVRHL